MLCGLIAEQTLFVLVLNEEKFIFVLSPSQELCHQSSIIFDTGNDFFVAHIPSLKSESYAEVQSNTKSQMDPLHRSTLVRF